MIYGSSLVCILFLKWFQCWKQNRLITSQIWRAMSKSIIWIFVYLGANFPNQELLNWIKDVAYLEPANVLWFLHNIETCIVISVIQTECPVSRTVCFMVYALQCICIKGWLSPQRKKKSTVLGTLQIFFCIFV